MDGPAYRSHPAVGPHPQAPRRGWSRPAGSRPAHLVRGHLAHGAVGLHGLQLFETPVQLLQCLPGQLLTCLFWRRGSTGGDPEAPARDDGGPPGERGAGKGQLRQPPQVKGPPPPTGGARGPFPTPGLCYLTAWPCRRGLGRPTGTVCKEMGLQHQPVCPQIPASPSP